MKYRSICEAIFLSRPNRFIAKVLLEGREETVHVKNTGRCKELLVPGARVILTSGENEKRKTKYDLIAVYKRVENKIEILINMDSQMPNDVVKEWIEKGTLFSKNAQVRREVTFLSSRFDLYVEDGERKAFLEVKGVTLEKNGNSLFPDAPTERGKKHLRELMEAKRRGFEAYVIFVIQMKGIRSFSPNESTDPEFSSLLRQAFQNGVEVIALDSVVTPDSICADLPVPVLL